MCSLYSGRISFRDEGAKFLATTEVVLIASNRTPALAEHFGNNTLWINEMTEGVVINFFTTKYTELAYEKARVWLSPGSHGALG